MQPPAIHARGIVACIREVIPPDLIALIVEDLVADGTEQYVELDVRMNFAASWFNVLARFVSSTSVPIETPVALELAVRGSLSIAPPSR